jgi:hypothetical protein
MEKGAPVSSLCGIPRLTFYRMRWQPVESSVHFVAIFSHGVA